MTIERLEWLRQDVYDAFRCFKDLHPESEIIIDKRMKDVQSLIKAEIERESMTDEVVQEAVDWLSSQREDDFAVFKDDREIAKEEVVYFTEVILQSLRNWQPVEKTDMLEPCDVCDVPDEMNGIKMIMRFDMYSYDTDEEMYLHVRQGQTPFNYCPNCGREIFE